MCEDTLLTLSLFRTCHMTDNTFVRSFETKKVYKHRSELL